MNLLLLAGIVLLLVAVVRIWGGGGGCRSAAAAQGPEVPKAPVLRDQQPLSAFQSVVAQNLFSQDRNAPAGRWPRSRTAWKAASSWEP